MVAQPLAAAGGLRTSLSLSPLGTAHHHIDLTATTLRAHQAIAPVKHGRIGAVALCHLGGLGFHLMTATLAPHD